MARVLVSPLSWGLGHAARTTPIVREFLKRGHSVTIATSGRALLFMRKEFPQCETIEFKDYPAPFTTTPFFVAKFTLYIPAMLDAIQKEKSEADRLFAKKKYDLIISDARFGVYSNDTPSFFINHQLRFNVPVYLKPWDFFSELFHTHFHTNFLRVIVPDNPPGETSIAGILSTSSQALTNKLTYYAGIITGIKKMNVREDIDYLITMSNPIETGYFEKKIFHQASHLKGKKVIILGKPGKEFEYALSRDTLVKSYATQHEMAMLINRAKFIITRGGYTTLMEIAELGKKHAMMIPIPGHTEQQYLAKHAMEKGWFFCKNQYKLSLVKDTRSAMKYNGFPKMPKTRENLEKLFEEVFAPYL